MSNPISVRKFQQVTGLSVLDAGKKGQVDKSDQFFRPEAAGLQKVTYAEAMSIFEKSFDEKLAKKTVIRPAENVAQANRPLTNDQLLFCQNKSTDRIKSDFGRRLEHYDVVIGTKADAAQFEALKADPMTKGMRVEFDALSGVLTVEKGTPIRQGNIVVAAGGPADKPVAEEAARIAEAMGNKVTRVYDFANADQKTKDALATAGAIIAIAGSQPDLPNAIAALTKAPVIAAPTSAAFGDGLTGTEHLLGLFAKTVDGVSIVNTDNGFGAAYVADKINRDSAKAAAIRPLGWESSEHEAHGKVVITTAGSADIPVAEKTALELEKKGVPVLRLYDRGVNDPHNVSKNQKIFENAAAVVVAAGLEGGLPNAVAAMTQRPIISVPTSVGYGTGKGGVASLLCSLNACSPGITVVNIDDANAAAAVAEKISAKFAAAKETPQS